MKENDVKRRMQPERKQNKNDESLTSARSNLEKEKNSIKQDVSRKEEEIRNSTIGGF